MRRRIRITESQLRRTVNSAVRRLLRESEEDAAYASWEDEDEDDDYYYNHRQEYWIEDAEQEKAIIDEIVRGEVEATKLELGDEPCSCSVYVQTKDGDWGEWVDVFIDKEWKKYNIVDSEWHDRYLGNHIFGEDEIKWNEDVRYVVFRCAEEYAEKEGVIAQWEAENTNESRMRRKRRR